MIYETQTANARYAIQVERIRSALEAKWTTIQNASYETGLTGLALFYCYYARYSGDTKYDSVAQDFFEKGIATLDPSTFSRLHRTDSLDCQLAHTGRIIEFVRSHRLFELDADAYLSNLDESMAVLMKSKISLGNFDLYSGALAAGYYFLSRPVSDPEINANLAALVNGLEEMAVKDPEGDYSWKVPTLGNRVFLGISHGNALIISFLGNVYERGVKKAACERIMRKAIAFLLKHKFRFKKGLFPNWIGEIDDGLKQFSVCYGDIGIGYALLRAADLLRDPSLLAWSDMILTDCLARKKEDGLTLDASIIYGASGLAAAYEKLYRISREARFWQASDYWYSQIPEYAVHENEFAGYSTKLGDVGDMWNTSFGYGITGIAITLIRYIRPELPALDPLLFIA